MPAISIIVPVYKAERYLNRCLTSICNQIFSDLEIILIDDGSPDHSGEMCDQWEKRDSRIRVIHQKNAGAGAARNAGLAIARGDYIGFVDSDNWIAPLMYQQMYESIRNTNSEMAIVKWKMVKKNFTKKFQENQKEKYKIYAKKREDILDLFFRVHGEEDTSIFDVGTKLISRKIMKGFRFIEGTISEDIRASFFFISHSDRIALIDEKFYYYYCNPEGVTRTKVTRKDFEYTDAYRSILSIVKKDFPMYEDVARFSYIRSYYTILSKMKLYGYDKEDELVREKYKEYKIIVRKNFRVLIQSNMPISRKILLIMICI